MLQESADLGGFLAGRTIASKPWGKTRESINKYFKTGTFSHDVPVLKSLDISVRFNFCNTILSGPSSGKEWFILHLELPIFAYEPNIHNAKYTFMICLPFLASPPASYSPNGLSASLWPNCSGLLELFPLIDCPNNKCMPTITIQKSARHSHCSCHSNPNGSFCDQTLIKYMPKGLPVKIV